MKTTVKSIIKSLNINKYNSPVAYGSRLDCGSYVFTNGHILYELTKNNELNNSLLQDMISYFDALKIAGYKHSKSYDLNRNTKKLNDSFLDLAKRCSYQDCFNCKKN